jgi:hypothetical protein
VEAGKKEYRINTGIGRAFCLCSKDVKSWLQLLSDEAYRLSPPVGYRTDKSRILPFSCRTELLRSRSS